MIQSFQRIPRDKFNQFKEILGACGGWYLSNPMVCRDAVHVSIAYDDVAQYNEHQRRWNRINLEIVERRRLPWWKRLFSKTNDKDLARRALDSE